MNELAQFLGYVTKVFAMGRVVRGVRSDRPYAKIPTRPLLLSMLMGVAIRVGSYLDLSKQTKRWRWQHLIHWQERISDDAFHYVSERFYLEDLRQGLAGVNKNLKANKALESCKINGLLLLSLDANEHFHSRSRCCPCCCQREIQETDDQGQKHTVIEYYHRYVFAQIKRAQVQRAGGRGAYRSRGRGSPGRPAPAGADSPALRRALFQRRDH